MTDAPRGAGRGGGLLFLAVLVFVAYLAVRVVTGVAELVIGLVAFAVVVAFLGAVLRRR